MNNKKENRMKKLLALALLAPFALGASLNAVVIGGEPSVYEGSEAYYLTKINNYFKSFAKKNSKSIILRRQTTTPEGEVIATYKNPLYGQGKRLIGGQTQEVEVRFIGVAAPGSEEHKHKLLTDIDQYFKGLKSKEIQLNRNAGTRVQGTTIATYENPEFKAKTGAGKALNDVSVQYIGKKTKIISEIVGSKGRNR